MHSRSHFGGAQRRSPPIDYPRTPVGALIRASHWINRLDENGFESTDVSIEERGSHAGPFIFIATNRLKTGRLEYEKNRVPGLVEFIQANELD